MAAVYLLRCADDSLYCGWTTDVERRLAAHQAGTASRYTRSRLPVALAWLTYTDIATPDQATGFWRSLGHAGQYSGPEGEFYRQCDPKWLLESWKQRAGVL